MSKPTFALTTPSPNRIQPRIFGPNYFSFPMNLLIHLILFIAQINAQTDCAILNSWNPSIPSSDCCNTTMISNLSNITIRCDQASSVTFLRASNASLEGSTASLGMLPKLQLLNLADNNFKSIDPALLSKQTLIAVSFAYNLIESFPLFTSTRLEYLNLAHNKISGNVPAEIQQWKGIKGLFINGNNFGGRMPDISSFSLLGSALSLPFRGKTGCSIDKGSLCSDNLLPNACAIQLPGKFYFIKNVKLNPPLSLTLPGIHCLASQKAHQVQRQQTMSP